MAFLCKWILPKLHRELLLLLYAICKIPKAIKSPKFKIVTITTISQKTICSVSISPKKTERYLILIFINCKVQLKALLRFVSRWSEKLSVSFRSYFASVALGNSSHCLLSQVQVTSLCFSNFHLELKFFVDFNLFSMFALSFVMTHPTHGFNFQDLQIYFVHHLERIPLAKC